MSLHKTLHLPFYWERDAHRLRFWTLGQFQHYFRTTVWCRYLFMNTLPHKLYSTILSLFLRKPDDVHCQPKHVIYQNITSYKLMELCFLKHVPILYTQRGWNTSKLPVTLYAAAHIALLAKFCFLASNFFNIAYYNQNCYSDILIVVYKVLLYYLLEVHTDLLLVIPAGFLHLLHLF